MEYRTNNMDIVSDNNIPNYLLTQIMLQDAFLTNYKIALGIVDEVIDNESDNKQIWVNCKVAVQQQKAVLEDGTPVFKDYPIIPARVCRWGNNDQPISTNIIPNQLCLLLFADRPFDNVWTQQPNEETGLIDTLPLTAYRAHNLGDAICIPFSHDVSLTDITTIRDNIAVEGNIYQVGDMSTTGDLYVGGNLTVQGNLSVVGNISGAHIEAGDGFTGVKDNATFNKGICIS